MLTSTAKVSMNPMSSNTSSSNMVTSKPIQPCLTIHTGARIQESYNLSMSLMKPSPFYGDVWVGVCGNQPKWGFLRNGNSKSQPFWSPHAPWDWNIYLHENLKFRGNVGNVCSHGAFGKLFFSQPKKTSKAWNMRRGYSSTDSIFQANWVEKTYSVKFEG